MVRRPRLVLLAVTLLALAGGSYLLLRVGEPWVAGQVRSRLLALLDTAPECLSEIQHLDVDLPAGQITVGDLSVRCGQSGFLNVPEAELTVDLLPLLTGRVAVESLHVRSPVVHWEGPAPRLPVAAAPGHATGAGSRGRSFSLRELSLSDGRVHLALPDGGGEFSLEGVRVITNDFWDGSRMNADVAVASASLNHGPAQIRQASVRGLLKRDDHGMLHLENLQVAGEHGAMLSGSGRLNWVDDVADYEFQGDAELPAAFVHDLGLLPASVRLSRGVEWRGAIAGQGARWRISGDVHGGDVVALGLGLREVRAEDVLFAPSGSLSAALSASTLDGTVTAGIKGQGVDGVWSLAGESALNNLNLRLLPPALSLPQGWPGIASILSGTVEGELPLDRPSAATASAALALDEPQGPPVPGTVAPSGSLRGDLSAGVLNMQDGTFRLGELAVDLGGAMHVDGTLDMQGSVSSRDLGATARRLTTLVPGLPDDLAGRLSWDGRLAAGLFEPVLDGQLHGSDLVVQSLPLGTLDARLLWLGDGLRVEQVHLAGPLGELQGEGTWAPSTGEATARVQLESLALEPLADLFGFSGQASGVIAGGLALNWRGEELTAEIDLEGERLVVLQRPLDGIKLAAVLNRDGLTLREAHLRHQGGRMELTGTIPWQRSAAPGSLSAPVILQVVRFPLDDLLQVEGFSGRLYASGNLSLALQSTEAQGRIDVSLVHLAFRDWMLPAIEGDLLLSPDALTARLRQDDPSVELQARIEHAPDFPFTVEVTAGELRLAAVEGMGDLLLRSSSVALQASGTATRLQDLEGRLEIRGLALDTTAGPLEAVGPVLVAARGAELELAPLIVRMGEEEVSIVGQATLGEEPRYSIQAVGMSNLRNWSDLMGGTLEMNGTAVLDVRLESDGGHPHLLGDLVVRDGYVRDPELFPNALEQMDAHATLDGEKLVLRALTGRMGGGRLKATGEMELLGYHPGTYRFQLASEGVATRYPEGVRTVGDAQVTLTGDGGTATIAGRVEMLRGRYSEDFRIESRLMSRPPPRLPPPPGPLDNIRLDLEIVAPGQLWIDNDFARAEFRTDLHLGGTASRPITSGLVELNRSGRLTFRDVEYDIADAAFTFSPAYPNDPVMDIQARTQVSTYTVTLDVSGRMSKPELRLSSEPDLAEDEIVVLLLTGGIWDDPSESNTQSLAMTGYLGGAMLTSTAIERITGIDQARIDPVFVEGQGDPTARLTLTERLSDRLTASWSTTLGDAQGNTAELRYRVLPHMELRTAQEETGASVIEGRYVRSFPSRMQRRQRLEGPPEPSGRRLGRRLLVGEVAVEGEPENLGEEVVRDALGLRPGSEVISGDILRAAAGARGRLLEEGYLMARVDCTYPDAGDEEPVDITCMVQPGPVIGLQLEGVRRRKDRRQLVSVIQEEWLEVVRVEDLPRAAAAAARRWYLNRGHAGVEAKAAFGTDEEGQEVVQVDLNPGPLVRVTKVILDGGEVLNQELLRRHLLSASRVVLRHSLVTPSILAHDREALVRLFAGSGYLDVKVSEPALEWRGRDEVVLTFRIEPGTRRLVSEVVFLGVDAALAPEIRERFAPEIGQPPEPDKLEDSVVDLQHFYDENGYADAIVYWRLERSDDGGARVRFDVQEGPMLTVRQVIIDGLVVTREYVVRREIEVAPGDVYRRSQLLATQRRVRDLGMFRSVVVRGEDVPGVDGLRDLVIEVKERDNLDLAVGLGFDNDEGVRASFSLGNRNYLGRGGTLSFQGRISGELISGELRNGWRRLGGSHNDLLGALSIRQQIRQGFSEERQAAVLQMSRPINRRTTLQARYRLENFSLYDVETFLPNETNLNETFVQEGRLGSIGGSLVRKTFDDPLLPGKGALRTIDLSLYSRDLGSQFEFGRFFFQQGRVWTFHEGRWGYLLNGRFGFMWPYGDTGAVPLAERFFAGGISSVRGYRQDRLGPANTSTGEPIGGESVFVLNNEVRLRLSGNLSARIFVDAGNAFLRARDIDLGDLKYTAGPGLSYATPVGPLRMYYGFKLNPETDEEESGRFHVTFGAVF